jgi:hypothetical protein
VGCLLSDGGLPGGSKANLDASTSSGGGRFPDTSPRKEDGRSEVARTPATSKSVLLAQCWRQDTRELHVLSMSFRGCLHPPARKSRLPPPSSTGDRAPQLNIGTLHRLVFLPHISGPELSSWCPSDSGTINVVVWPELELRKIGLRRRCLERDVAFSVCAIFGGKWAGVAQPLPFSRCKQRHFKGRWSSIRMRFGSTSWRAASRQRQFRSDGLFLKVAQEQPFQA